MQLDPNLTVGALATSAPHAVRVLERHRIDYCCGGGRTLAEVAAQRGLALDTLAAEIDAARPRTPGTVDWATLPLPELIDHIIVTYHRPLEQELRRLGGLARKVCAVHGPKDPSRFAELLETFLAVEAEILPHMEKEEEILFPWIKAGRGQSAGAPIRVMQEDHEVLGRLLVTLRKLTDDYEAPPDACGSWRALWDGLAELEQDLHAHIHLENNVLFPRALA